MSLYKFPPQGQQH